MSRHSLVPLLSILCFSPPLHAHPDQSSSNSPRIQLPDPQLKVAQAPGPDGWMESGGEVVIEIHPVAPAPPPPPPLPARVVYRRPQLDLIAQDPCYRAAKRKRTAGILLTTIGPSVGLLTLTAGLAMKAANHYSNEKNETLTQSLIWGGLGTMVVTLAIGIPTIVSGHREVKAIRNGWMQRQFRPVAMINPHGATVGVGGGF